ncbi:MAG TPA: archaetidylserine decarboxylase [Xanthobacteraceae bacterium]|nr:archaetidylserine decarboxylase [Xanthobacteraceae bacterium]
MTVRAQLLRIFEQEDVNFLLTNRIPRRLATQFTGWFSRIEQPLIRDLSIATWRLFADLDLGEAKTTAFKSLHDCFIRELKDGARPIDPAADILVSPCDAIVGACGAIAGTQLYQAKGFPYALQDLLCDPALVEAHRNGRYVTLRLTSSMYHRFHAPHDGRIDRVIYLSGDTWNVNPIALKRIERLFCKNERAVVPMTLAAGGQAVTLVAIAAILVAGIRLHCLGGRLARSDRARTVSACDSRVRKGEELGWFEHGSTMIVFTPERFTLCENVREGAMIRVGQPLFRLP